MLYLRADHELQSFSHSRQDWLTIVENELLTERELARYQRMGFRIRFSDFTPIVTSQKNVKIDAGVRLVIDESKIVTYWKGNVEK